MFWDNYKFNVKRFNHASKNRYGNILIKNLVLGNYDNSLNEMLWSILSKKDFQHN